MKQHGSRQSFAQSSSSGNMMLAGGSGSEILNANGSGRDAQTGDKVAWIFDVDEEDLDIVSGDVPLLKELEIDLNHIYRSILWMFTSPWTRFCGRSWHSHVLEGRHPIHVSSSVTIDFWGPCAVVSCYGALLWLGHVKDVPWTYVIWTCAAVFNHLTSRVFFSTSSIMLHYAIMGYSVAPVIPLAGIILVLHPPIWLATLIECAAVLWASLSALLSYLMICRHIPQSDKKRLLLLVPSILLMELYLISLLPIRRWQQVMPRGGGGGGGGGGGH